MQEKLLSVAFNPTYPVTSMPDIAIFYIKILQLSK